MKKIICKIALYVIVILTMLGFCPFVFAATTATLSGTVTDPDGQTWNNGTYTFALNNPYGGQAYDSAGSVVAPQSSGALSSLGVFSGTITRNDMIVPFGTSWTITVCQQSSAPCQTLSPISITATTFNAGAFVSGLITAPRFTSETNHFGPITAEVSPVAYGSMFFDTTILAYYFYNGTLWKQATTGPITLTTTGTSGAATYSGGTLNIPQYQGVITVTTTGSGGASTFVTNTLNIPVYQTALGYTPANVAGDTITGNWIINGTTQGKGHVAFGANSSINYSFPTLIPPFTPTTLSVISTYESSTTNVGVNGNLTEIDWNPVSNITSANGSPLVFGTDFEYNGDGQANTANLYPNSIIVDINSNTAPTAEAIAFSPEVDNVGTGAVTNMFGIQSIVANLSSGTIAGTASFDAGLDIEGGAVTLYNAYSSGSVSLSGGGTLATRVGFHDYGITSGAANAVGIEIDQVTGSSTSYSIKGNSTAPYYMNGPWEGPSTAPSGACAQTGMWELTQDGNIRWCSTTWQSPAIAVAATLTDQTASRAFGVSYHNTSGAVMMVQGYGQVNSGSGDSTIACIVGPSSPTLTVWSMATSVTVANETVPFSCTVPNGYYYEITITNLIKTLTSGGKWYETVL